MAKVKQYIVLHKNFEYENTYTIITDKQIADPKIMCNFQHGNQVFELGNKFEIVLRPSFGRVKR